MLCVLCVRCVRVWLCCFVLFDVCVLFCVWFGVVAVAVVWLCDGCVEMLLLLLLFVYCVYCLFACTCSVCRAFLL